jgi:hypothetical protein
MAVEVSIEDPNGCRCLNLGSQSLSRSHKKKGIQSHLTSGLILPLSFAYLFFTFDVFFPLYRNQQPSSSYSVGAFVEQCLTNCSRHHQPSPKQKFGVLLEDPQRLSSSQLRIPNYSTEIWGLIKRNGSKASHLASWLILQISRSFHFWVYLFMTFLVFYFHPLSRLLSFSQLTPFSYFHPLSSEICEQLSRNCSRHLAFLETKYRRPVQVPIEVSMDDTKVCQGLNQGYQIMSPKFWGPIKKGIQSYLASWLILPPFLTFFSNIFLFSGGYGFGLSHFYFHPLRNQIHDFIFPRLAPVSSYFFIIHCLSFWNLVTSSIFQFSSVVKPK